MVVLLADIFSAEDFLTRHSGQLTFLVVIALVLLTLLILAPQILRWHQRALEMHHAERMKALEQGQSLPPPDPRSVFAGRTASLVPIVVICAAGTVTCFLAGYGADSLFAVTLAVWSVAGVVSLAAITGGVALMGRLAQLQHGAEEELPENPLEK
ncbi:MAG TPA: hypothetical protein VNK04_15380 [Gemmataceae bacterium]|nr:hypothetical protein [Gemmataceae bacterium]